jgi:hypothetical protein
MKYCLLLHSRIQTFGGALGCGPSFPRFAVSDGIEQACPTRRPHAAQDGYECGPTKKSYTYKLYEIATKNTINNITNTTLTCY